MYVLVYGFGERNSKRVAIGVSTSRIKPQRIVRLRLGKAGLVPKDVTIHTGASKPGFKRFKESVVEEINGLIAS